MFFTYLLLITKQITIKQSSKKLISKLRKFIVLQMLSTIQNPLSIWSLRWREKQRWSSSHFSKTDLRETMEFRSKTRSKESCTFKIEVPPLVVYHILPSKLLNVEIIDRERWIA